MKFNVYSGEYALNYSVNITYHGFFEADSIQAAIEIIEINKKYRYCKPWQFPYTLKDKCVESLLDAFRFKAFVCKEEPFWKERNIVWKDPDAVINYFSSAKSL